MEKMERPQHGSRWTAEEDDRLRVLAETGAFLPAMARALGRSQESVRTRANILKVPVRSSDRSRQAPVEPVGILAPAPEAADASTALGSHHDGIVSASEPN